SPLARVRPYSSPRCTMHLEHDELQHLGVHAVEVQSTLGRLPTDRERYSFGALTAISVYACSRMVRVCSFTASGATIGAPPSCLRRGRVAADAAADGRAHVTTVTPMGVGRACYQARMNVMHLDAGAL